MYLYVYTRSGFQGESERDPHTCNPQQGWRTGEGRAVCQRWGVRVNPNPQPQERYLTAACLHPAELIN